MNHKEKARLDRETLILDVALALLKEQGLQGVTMQAIANGTDYSKGTIYQHFGCKEDVITKLVAQCGQRLVGMIDLATENATGLRHKIALVSWAFFINAEMHPELTRFLALAKSPEFQSKVDESLQAELAVIDQSILSRVVNLFVGQPGVSAEKVMVGAFGWWAMKWGVQDVMVNDWELSKLGFDDPRKFFFDALHVFLDGLGVEQDELSQNYLEIQTQANSIFNIQ